VDSIEKPTVERLRLCARHWDEFTVVVGGAAAPVAAALRRPHLHLIKGARRKGATSHGCILAPLHP
jgi:hypothetical protein